MNDDYSVDTQAKPKRKQKPLTEEQRRRRAEQSAEWRKKNRLKMAEYMRQYCQKNKERLREQKRQYQKTITEEQRQKQKANARRWYEKNKASSPEWARQRGKNMTDEQRRQREKKLKEWREKNKDRIREQAIQRYNKNRERLLNGQREYYKNLTDEKRAKKKERTRIHMRAWAPNRRKTNPSFRISMSLRIRLNEMLKVQKARKTNSTLFYLGCSFDFLRAHLESQFQKGMNWNNYGHKGWHIDHIVPCASFDLTKEDERKKCFHFSNLRPLWAVENIKKQAKIITCQPELPIALA